MKSPTIKPSEHVFIAGQTGTGKSKLAEIYLRGYDHVVKLDTKGEYYERKRDRKPVWEGLTEGDDYTVIFKLSDIDKVDTPKIIYVPVFEEQSLEYYDALMKWVYERENTILWIDELMSISDSPTRYPLYLRALMTRGRSKNATVWALTQRPMDIPSIILANSSHYFVFTMQLPQDRKKIADATGQPEFLEQPKGYNFWYFKVGSDRPVLARLKL
jgi:DNA helicase HerA-like ATPase